MNQSTSHHLDLELAFIRWATVCIRWNDLSNGHAPYLTAFLAGWGCRCMGMDNMATNKHSCQDSFNTGWYEADQQIQIAMRPKLVD